MTEQEGRTIIEIDNLKQDVATLQTQIRELTKIFNQLLDLIEEK